MDLSFHIQVFMQRNYIEALIGMIVLVVTATFMYFLYKQNNQVTNDSYLLIAKFDRIDGINVNNDVKMGGVKVGKVKSIDFDSKTYRAKIVISIRKDLLLPDDSSIEIASESLLGGKYIAIIPGGSDVMLAANDEISYTSSSLSLESLISKFLFAQSAGNKN